MGVTYKRIRVKSINEDTGVASCVSKDQTIYECRVDTTPGGTRRPLPREEWIIDRIQGSWHFTRFLNTPPQPIITGNIHLESPLAKQLLAALVTLGLVVDHTTDTV